MAKAKVNTREQDDQKFLETYAAWPCWPYCPVKRYQEGDTQCGLVIADSFDHIESKVYLVNMFSVGELYSSGKTLKDVKSIDYPSIEAIVADGWRVD